MAVDLGNNNFSGIIPETIGSLLSLESPHLNNNSLAGELPSSLKNCIKLVALDLGENQISGNIPSWIGKSLPNLVILRLHSNKFAGSIPPELFYLSSLQVLDIAQNTLSGIIPRSFGNLAAMTKIQEKGFLLYENWGSYLDSILVYMKGRELQYSKTLGLVTSVDLSSNNLFGEIPEELTSLFGLLVLNLSKNALTGEIPKKIGNLRWLESLDLSRNNLSDEIPSSISSLTSLSQLNLSYNHLKGRIPSGFQLQTLSDPSIYIGNQDLCGPPLTDSCPGDGDSSPSKNSSITAEEDGSEFLWFYSGISPGFGVGILGVFSVLFFMPSWRYALFMLIDHIVDWFYVTISLTIAMLR
uniref:Receptor-like protein EIX2 n=1 Tax=Elaeis guineensis var. tenera TaxID=51953 RepID=A0A6I9QN30_ELAGV|nr:receptor-like protein EIX2 [Elaeis guineensis]